MAARASSGFGERTNEYFVDGEGISREVIQADICRYLGNDALVRTGTNQQGRQGYIITAYRNLTSNMIADLKTDSARWEQDVSRRAEQGINRGTYIQSGIRDGHQQTGPPVYSAPPQYEPVYSQPPQHAPQYGSVQSNQGYMQYQHSPAYGHNTYPQSQSPYNPNQSQPPISSSDMHPSSYIHQGGPGYPPYTEGRPRYTGPGEEYEQEYIPVTSGMSYPTTAGMAYPPTTVPDMRMGDVRYPPDSYQEQVRAQPRERDSHRRQR